MRNVLWLIPANVIWSRFLLSVWTQFLQNRVVFPDRKRKQNGTMDFCVWIVEIPVGQLFSESRFLFGI